MKKIVVGFIVVWVCLLGLPNASQAQASNEATIRAQVAWLYQEIMRLERLIAEQNQIIAPAQYGTYTYNDAESGLSVTYRADTEFAVLKTSEVNSLLQAQLGSVGKYKKWEFYQGNQEAAIISALDQSMYELVKSSIGFLDFVATLTATNPEPGVTFKTSPGWQEKNGFSYKTVSFADGLTNGGFIIGLRPFKETALGGKLGGFSAAVSWGNNLDQIDSDYGLQMFDDSPSTDDVYFRNERAATALFNDLIGSINYPE